MRKNTWQKGLATTLILGLVVSSITGCGSSKDSKKTEDGKTIIKIGAGNSYEPYCYLDEDGKAVGYEYDVLAAVDDRLEDYEFEYEAMDFDNILLSLDSGKIDLAAHQYEETEERREQYLFSDVPYTTFNTYITVLADNNDITSLDDLQGKKVWAGGTTSASNQILLNYNAEHPDNPIELINNDDTSAEYQVTSLQNGAFVASINQERDVVSFNEEYNNVLKTVGEPVNSSLTYWLFAKDNTELKEVIDGALQELKDDGTLAEISEKWLGGDYTK